MIYQRGYSLGSGLFLSRGEPLIEDNDGESTYHAPSPYLQNRL
jgi:hypothetical protein